MSQSSQNSPVGKLFYHEEDNDHEADVVVLGLRFSTSSNLALGGIVTELTLLTSLVLPTGESQIVLQRFSADGRPSVIELDPETLNLLSREASIMLEKRIRTTRNNRLTR